MYEKTSQKLNALSRVAYQLDFNRRKLPLNAFITSQFSHPPVVWMFHSRKKNHRRNHTESHKIAECPYALRNELKLNSRKILYVSCGIETAYFIGARAWSLKA